MNRIILRDSNENIWEFFCNENNDLCYIKDRKESILQSNVHNAFDVITDSEGNFHVIIQDTSANLIYLTFVGNQWRKFVILSSKSAETRMQNFKMFMINKRLHCFYTLDFNGKYMLVHHIFSSSAKSTTPDAIDYCDASKNFGCAFDGKNKIHIFYSDCDGTSKYKIYSTDSNAYTDSSIDVEDHITSVRPIWGSNSLHILYTAKIKTYYALIYYNFSGKERKIISFGDCCSADECIYIYGNDVFIQWREHMRFYECSSSDGGVSFKKPSPINETKGKRAVPVKIRQATNPYGTDIDYCIALHDGTDMKILNQNACFGKSTVPPHHLYNHTSGKTDYNISEEEGKNDEMKFIRSKLKENEKELIRLNTIINTLSDKVSCLVKNHTSNEVTYQAQPSLVTETDNYEFFKNTDINDMNFENSKKF